MPHLYARHKPAPKSRARVAMRRDDWQRLVLTLLFLTMAWLYWGNAARAETPGDPFSFTTTEWKSLDRFQEELKQSSTTGNPSSASASPPMSADADETTMTQGDDSSSIPSVETAKPSPAPLTRAVNIPLLPGINKGYDVHVTSTAEDRSEPPTAYDQPTHLNAANWQKVENISQSSNDDASAEDQPLQIRMSFLPDATIIPVDSPEKKKPVRKTIVASQPKPKTPAEAAACAAIDADKKRQLTAIQNDQKTLQALQAAIKELGLNKDLDFLTTTEISGGAASSAPIDTAPSLPGVRAN